MKKIAVFASGNGSNFQVIAEQFPVEFVFSLDNIIVHSIQVKMSLQHKFY